MSSEFREQRAVEGVVMAAPRLAGTWGIGGAPPLVHDRATMNAEAH